MVEAKVDADNRRSVTRRRLAVLRCRVPLALVAWLLGYWAPWLPAGSGTTWLALSAWGSTHGLHQLALSSLFVTTAVTFCSLLGATLRVWYAALDSGRSTMAQFGWFAVGAPLSVLLPVTGAALYLTVLALASLAGFWSNQPARVGSPMLPRLVGEAFPILAAGCFLAMSWQYNAQLLTRGLLVSAGLSLLGWAIFPLGNAIVR